MAEQKMSPMMVQYLETKKQYPDCILFYRIGDFYEMFFDDAKLAAEELELVLTGKDCGLTERAPMCGIPYHAAENYIGRLVKKGYKVAIGEQVEDPKLAKGLVKREVIRVYTPGTIMGTEALEEKRNNFLLSIAYVCSEYGIAAIDVSTGEFFATSVSEKAKVYDELNHYRPSEIICNDAFLISGIDTEEIKARFHTVFSDVPGTYYSETESRKLLEEHFKADAYGLGLGDMPAAMAAAGAVLKYVYDTQFSTVAYVNSIRIVNASQFMIIDSAAMRNLELLETLREKEKKGTLLWVLDKTKTAMGGRYLRRIISEPLIDKNEIERRQDAVEELNERFIDREEISEYLRPVYDLERLLSSVSGGRADARDLLAVKSSLAMIPHIKAALSSFGSDILKEICEGMPELKNIHDLLENAICDDAPASLRDGGLIREGYSDEADRLKSAGRDGKKWLLELEAEEREKTGIKGLKVKFNKVFGYCIEVSNSIREEVPDYFIRKQTLTTGERYTTEKLEELADTILGAEDRLKSLEYSIFTEIRDEVASHAGEFRDLGRRLALLDVLCSLSYVAMRNNYVRPVITEKGAIKIKDGRHPVVELMLRDGTFVPNDTFLDEKDHRVAIITGPNMAGKSTYMRQTALIVIMAQIGSFVPAASAEISICDRVFTRVGASDDLSQGQSTFMVEMTEVANILRNATRNSLLILDEIGRGTSTYDGLSIAWAVVEYVSNLRRIGAKTLFATHYHELTELEGRIKGVQNYCIAVRENEDDLVFLRKIIPGGADKSYGIAVAKLAGVPGEVIKRASEISGILSESDINKTRNIDDPHEFAEQDKMPEKDDLLRKRLKETDVTKLTPIEALLLVDELKKSL